MISDESVLVWQVIALFEVYLLVNVVIFVWWAERRREERVREWLRPTLDDVRNELRARGTTDEEITLVSIGFAEGWRGAGALMKR